MVKKEKDTRWLRISVRNVLEKTDIRRRADNIFNIHYPIFDILKTDNEYILSDPALIYVGFSENFVAVDASAACHFRRFVYGIPS